MNKIVPLLTLFSVCFVGSSFAGEADVKGVQVAKAADKTYSFEVTVAHADSGWDHYADKWEVVDENNTILGTRILHHPHVNEQPFTRGLSGVDIPDRVKWVEVRAHDSVHEYGGETVKVKLDE